MSTPNIIKGGYYWVMILTWETFEPGKHTHTNVKRRVVEYTNAPPETKVVTDEDGPKIAIYSGHYWLVCGCEYPYEVEEVKVLGPVEPFKGGIK